MRINREGDCENCGREMILNRRDITQCIPLVCPRHHKFNTNGIECQECPLYQIRSEADDYLCETAKCSDRGIIMPDGSCKTCPDYMIADTKNMNCIYRTCAYSQYEYQKNGDCKQLFCDIEGIGFYELGQASYGGYCQSCDQMCSPKANKNIFSCRHKIDK